MSRFSLFMLLALMGCGGGSQEARPAASAMVVGQSACFTRSDAPGMTCVPVEALVLPAVQQIARQAVPR